MALTPKQQRFVDEYLVDANATQAAIRAGYSEKTARQAGAENLSKPVIRQAIEAAQAARSERTQVTADWVITQLKAEAEYHGEDASHSARVSALGLLGKHLRLFVDRMEIDGGIVLEIREEVVNADYSKDGTAAPGASGVSP